MTQFIWKSGTIGSWSTASNWAGGAVPDGSTADVTIANGTAEIVSGASFEVDFITLTSSAATLQVQGLLDLGGTHDSLLVSAGTLDVLSGGTIADGTINAGKGSVSFASGAVLQAVTYLGNLSIAAGQELDTEGGLTVRTASGTSPGTIVVGDGATLNANTGSANETLNNMVIDLGTSAGGAVLEHDHSGFGGVLELGSGVTVNAVGANDRIYDDGDATILNAGIINVDGVGFLIQAGASFGNSGTINIAAGDSLTESGPSFTSSGVIHVNGGTLVLDSAVSLASLGSISLNAASELDAAGTLALGGKTLTLTTGTLAGIFSHGTITAGSETFANDTTLEDITYRGNLTIASGQELDTSYGLIVKTASGTSPGTIVVGDGATLNANTGSANETLNNMVIDLGTSAGGAVLEHDHSGFGGVLELGSGVTVNAVGANDRIYDDGDATILNAGIINVDGVGFLIQAGASFGNSGTINIAAGDSLTESGPSFTSSGVIHVNGGTLVLDSAVSLASLGSISLNAASELDAAGTLALGGKTLTLTTGTLAGIFSHGTITAGSETFANDTTLEDITYRGNLTIASGQELDTSYGLIVKTASGTSPGTIVVGDGATLNANTGSANETLNNMVIDLGTSAGGAVLEHDHSGFGGVLELGSGVTVNAVGANDRIYDDGDATILNAGIINVDGVGFLIQAGASFGNSGTINIAAGDSLGISGGTFTNAGKTQLGGGTFSSNLLTNAAGASFLGYGTLAGPIANAGTINASGGTLKLTGALSGAGTLSAAAGATLHLTLGGNLTEAVTGAGTLELSGATPYNLARTLAVAAVKIDAGTKLAGHGQIDALADAGTVNATGGTLDLTGMLTGAGTLSAASGAVEDIAGGGNFSGLLSGAGTIQINSATTLSAGASLAASSVLENANVTLGADTAVTNAAGHAYGIAAAAGTVTLGGAGSFTNDGTLTKTGAGQADIGSAFINAGAVSIGSGTMDFLTAVSGSGSVGIAAGAKAVFGAGATASQALNFQSGTGALALASPAAFLATIGGFTASDTIDLLHTAATSVRYSGNKLTVSNGTTTVATLNFSGTYTTANFVIGTDNNGGSLITWKS